MITIENISNNQFQVKNMYKETMCPAVFMAIRNGELVKHGGLIMIFLFINLQIQIIPPVSPPPPRLEINIFNADLLE